MRKNWTLSACVAVATLAFYITNGGEDAPLSVQGLTLLGIVAALLTMPLGKWVKQSHE